MGRILKPMVRGGGWYPSKKWTPLVKNGGYTTQNGGETEPVWATASGAIASFTTPFAYPLKSLLVQIEPKQDLHGQSSPYPAGGGKNKINAPNVSVPANSDNYAVIVQSIILSAGTYTLSWTLDKNITATRNRPYYVPAGQSSPIVYGEPDSKTAGRHSWTFTLEEEKNLEFRWWYHTVSEACTISDFQLELGSTASTFAPYSNICPITGHTGVQGQRTGANLFDKSTGIQLETNNLRIARTQGQGVPFKLRGGVTYTFSYNSNTPAYIYVMQPYSSTVIVGAPAKATSFTYAPQEDIEIGLNFYWDTGRPSDATDFMIEVGSVAHDYAEYTGEAISVSFPTTVYGGQDEVVGGNGTSTMGIINVTGIEWDGISTLTDGSGYEVYKSGVFPVPPSICISDSYKRATAGGAWEAIHFGEFLATQYLIVTVPPEASTLQLAKAYLDNLDAKFVYSLATPTTFTHTGQSVDTLVGQNNVWVDTGDVEVTYRES